ncbi:MAG: serine hydrolase domain-containing protein [Erythrobacter sp.]
MPQPASATVPSQTSARPLSDPELAAFADGFIENAMLDSGIPGAALVLMRDGKVIFERGYGYADLAARRKVDIENTLFRQASISKLFVWLIALQLADEGKIDLDADISTYLDFRISGLDGAPITMRHLMTHTPGLAERVWGISEPDLTTPAAERLRKNIPEAVYAPDSTMAYSNYGAGLAVLAVERVSGAPFDELVAARIFAPVGMKRSTFVQPLPESLAPMLVSGYLPGERKPYRFEVIVPAGAGGMSASAGDMARFLGMLMAGGRGANGEVVTPATLAEATRLHAPLAPGLGSGFGLGFIIGDYRGVKHIRHAGNLRASATDLQYLPEYGIGWYLAFNGSGKAGAANTIREGFARALVDRWLVTPAPAVRASGGSTAQEVAGHYRITRRIFSGPLRLGEPFGLLRASAGENGTLVVDLAKRADGTPRRWLPDGPDRFVEEETGIPLVAMRDASGKITRIASPLIMPVAVFERAPTWLALVPWLFGGAAVIMLCAALAGPAGWAMRRALGAPALARSAGRISLVRRSARIAVWLIALTLVSIAVHYIRVTLDGDVVFKQPGIMLALAVLGALCIPAALVIAVDAAAAWRDPARRLARRLAGVLVAAAAAIVVWIFIALELITFSQNY